MLELNGSAVTSGQFPAGWTPVGAMQTANGYEVAFGNGANEYVVWNTDTNGDYTSAATGILSGTSYALEELEVTFGEDLNGDGTVGPTMATIATNSTTILTEVANQFELNPAGGGTGPFLELNGSPVTAGQFPAGWTPVGAIQTGDGYEVAFGATLGGERVCGLEHRRQRQLHERRHGGFVGHEPDARGDRSQLRRDLPRRDLPRRRSRPRRRP